MPISSANNIHAAWRACKDAHTAAKEMWETQGEWRPDTVRPWLDDLSTKARAFKAKYGIEFNPAIPVDAAVATEAA